MNFREAIDRYEWALKAAPSRKMEEKLWRKIEGLKKFDIACANNALARMMPVAEPPMNHGPSRAD